MIGGTVQYDFTNAIVVVTGGARGQGLSHAILFAKTGARVVVIDRDDAQLVGIEYSLCDSEQLVKARRLFTELATPPILHVADITNETATEQVFHRIAQEFGRIDILINNAGVNAVSSLEETDKSIWDAIIGVNLWGPFICSKYALPAMKQASGGRIVNISSMAAVLGVNKQSAYSASKAGLLGLTRSLAVELGVYGITVNAVCPTLVASPQTQGLSKLHPLGGMKAGMAAVSAYALPTLSALVPADVTAMVMWLCSEGAKYITGTVQLIDGGLSIK